jgi:hypothetical protein
MRYALIRNVSPIMALLASSIFPLTRKRKDSRSWSSVVSSGEMLGAVGRQRIVLGWAKL